MGPVQYHYNNQYHTLLARPLLKVLLVLYKPSVVPPGHTTSCLATFMFPHSSTSVMLSATYRCISTDHVQSSKECYN